MVADLNLAMRIRADTGRARSEIVALTRTTGGLTRGVSRAADNARRFGGAWDRASRSLGNARRTLFSLRGAVAALGLVAALRQIERLSTRQEQAAAQVERGIRNLGDETPLTSAGLQQIAAGLQDLTTFGDEAVLELQALLLTFRNIDPGVFERTTAAALDMAIAIGQAPRDAAVQLAKALEDPIQGLTALRRSGTVFTQEQQSLIRSLVESGRALEAQRLILDEIERQYGGAARAARETLGGALTALGNAFGDLLEGTGDTQELRLEVERLVGVLRDPATAEAVNVLGAALARGFLGAAEAVTSFTIAFGRLFSDSANLEIADLLRVRQLDPGDLERLKTFNEDSFIEFFDNEAIDARLNEVLNNLRDQGATLPQAVIDGIRASGADVRQALLDAVSPETLRPEPLSIPVTPDVVDVEPVNVEDAERDAANLAAAIAEIEAASARLRGPFSEALHQALLWRSQTLEAIGEINDATRGHAEEVERIFRERVAGAWQEELERRSQAHRDAIAAIEQQEESLDVGASYERAIQDAEAWRSATLAALDSTADGYEELRARAEAVFAAMASAAEDSAAEQERRTRGALGGIEQALDDYASTAGDSFAQARQAADRVFRGMEDALTRFVTTGKLSFSDLANSIIADLLRIQIQQNITGPLSGALGGIFGSIFGSTPTAPPRFFHSGGIVGGNEGDHVPVFARRGEGIFTPEQMAALGRSGGPSRLTVVLRNESSRPLEAEDDGGRIQGDDVYREIVIRDARQNGPATQALRHAILGGG